MAFYPDVNPGEPFKPIATLENELRHIVNAQNGFLGTVHTGSLPQSLVVPVYNCGEDDLEANSAVSFATEQQQYSLEDVAAAPVQKYTSGTRWGVLTSALAPKEFGSCIISGVAVVNFSGSGSPEALSPSTSGFVSGNEVTCLYASGGKAMIVLGAGSATTYNGYFTIKLRTLEDGTQKIVVCDGATYDAEKGTSGNSLAYTSGPSHWVPYYEVAATEADSKRYIVAEFTPPVYTADGTIDNDGYVSIVMCKDYYRYENGLESPVEGVYERYIYLIGEVIKDGDNIRVIQRHGMGLGGERTSQNYFNGAIYIEYYESCVS